MTHNNSVSLAQWLEQLERIHPTEIELGLERVSSVARSMELLPVQKPVVTIAGTNGKGSTAAVLEALLNEAGEVTGTFTSPHFLRFNERIRVAGSEAGDEDIVAAFEAIDAARADVSLTYFEFAALAALWVFRARKVDVLVLEVGLGGRLDAVNMVDPAVAVITSIDLDHQDWLGDTLADIAREKAGIVRSERPLVIGETSPPDALLERAREIGADPVLMVGRDFTLESSADEGCCNLWVGPGQTQRLPVQAPGALLPQNIGAALQAASLLGIEPTEALVQRALAGAAPAGRRESRQQAGRNYLLDVAHNPAAVNKLSEYIDVTHCIGKTIALFSPMGDKDARGMLQAAGERFDAWFLADQPDNPRAAAASDIAQLLREEGRQAISVSKNVRQAFRRAQSILVEGDRLVIFGSFNTVAQVLPLLDKDQRRSAAESIS